MTAIEAKEKWMENNHVAWVGQQLSGLPLEDLIMVLKHSCTAQQHRWLRS